MQIFILKTAEKEARKFPLAIQKKFGKYFTDFQNGEKLSAKEFKKLIGSDLAEFRVKGKSGTYRGLAGKVQSDLYVVLFFQKKSQKTPQTEIETANKRLNEFRTKNYEKCTY